MLFLRLRFALLSLSRALPAIADPTAISPDNLRPLLSLRAFSSQDDQPPTAAGRLRPRPATSLPKKVNNEESGGGESQAVDSAEEGVPGDQEEAGFTPPNALADSLKEKLAEHMAQLKSSTTVQESTEEDSLPSWQRYISDRFGAFFQARVDEFVRAKIDSQFDVNEWLEGAKDAIWMFNHLVGEEDYATLKGMVSSKVLQATQATGAEYRSNGLVWRTQVDPEEPLDAQLRRISFWDADQIREFDPQQAELAPEGWEAMAMPGGKWMVMSVQLKATQRTAITREEDAHIVAKMTDRRPMLFTFATGPLPAEGLPMPLETPYWMVKFA